MTTDQIIELSKQVAEVLKIPNSRGLLEFGPKGEPLVVSTWLAEDAGLCADIAADKMISVIYTPRAATTEIYGQDCSVYIEYADHNNERIKAYCVAVCKAVIEQAKG